MTVIKQALTNGKGALAAALILGCCGILLTLWITRADAAIGRFPSIEASVLQQEQRLQRVETTQTQIRVQLEGQTKILERIEKKLEK